MLRAGIVGATGYTGMEILRILGYHPAVKVNYLTSERYSDRRVIEIYPHLSGIVSGTYRAFDAVEAAAETDIIFSALPHGKSCLVVPLLLKAGGVVIDLSADFRLKNAALYESWYSLEHPAPDLLAEAVYGLPELNKGKLLNAKLIANPGCYPTASILALAPLAKSGLVKWDSVIIDAKSGVSGAGRSPVQALHFPECTENFKAYKVAYHQHIPEIEQELGLMTQDNVQLTFTPHLVPMVRGIFLTAYLKLRENISEEKLVETYRDFYREKTFIRIFSAPHLPETRFVAGTNFCDLALHFDRRTERVIVLAAIDNLVKGAAGQAIQNMNIVFGLPEDQGLKHLARLP